MIGEEENNLGCNTVAASGTPSTAMFSDKITIYTFEKYLSYYEV